MTSFALLFTLAAIGISETVYLVRKRLADQHPVCVIGEGCTKVLTSSYSRIFFVPNDVLGLLSYIAIATIAGLLVVEVEPMGLWWIILQWSIATAAVFSLALTYLQWRVIRAWCFWCVLSACTIWLMAITVFLF